MAYALVGSAGSPTSGTGTGITPAFGQSTSAGNLLIAWIWKGGSEAVSGPGGWSQAVESATNRAMVWYKPNSGAGESNPTFTIPSNSSATITAMVAEFSGGATTSPLDQIGATNGATSPQTVTAAAADAAAGQLVIACNITGLSKAGTHTSSATYNNGATAQVNTNNDSTSTTEHYRQTYGITTGNSAADNAQMSSTSMNLSSIILAVATFKLAAAGPVVSLVYDPQPFRHLRAR